MLLIELAFLATSGYLVLHALATPGVLLAGKNAGFQIASAIGLLEAGLFAAASAVRFHPETSAFLVRYRGVIYGLLILHMAAWAAVSLSTLPPLDDPVTPRTPAGRCAALAVVGASRLQLRRLALLEALPRTKASAPARDPRRARPALGGHVRGRLCTQLGDHVVGMAPPHARRVRGGRPRRAGANGGSKGSSAEIFSDIYEEQTRGHLEEVSVLFADMQGYTAFSERTPEPRSRQCWTRTFRPRPQFSRHTVARLYNTIGDALMVVFRGPEHELRAGRTGLEFQREMTRIADAHAGWPRFRAGVNSGDAVLGVIDAPGTRGYTATGDTVNLASRLEGQARAGEVVVSERPTRDSREARPTSRSSSSLSVKGKSEAVRAFVLRRPGLDGASAISACRTRSAKQSASTPLASGGTVPGGDEGLAHGGADDDSGDEES